MFNLWDLKHVLDIHGKIMKLRPSLFPGSDVPKITQLCGHDLNGFLLQLGAVVIEAGHAFYEEPCRTLMPGKCRHV